MTPNPTDPKILSNNDDEELGQDSSVGKDDDEDSLFPMEVLNVQLRNSELILQRNKLEEELKLLQQERQRMTTQYHTNLESLNNEVETLNKTKKALQKYCSQMEGLVREHRYFDTWQ